MHVLPKGFHRIRHYGLLASGNRARELLAVPARSEQPDTHEAPVADDADVEKEAEPLALDATWLRCPHHSVPG